MWMIFERSYLTRDEKYHNATEKFKTEREREERKEREVAEREEREGGEGERALTLKRTQRHTKALIFSLNSFSLSVRWLNLGLSIGVSAQHHPINTNLQGHKR